MKTLEIGHGDVIIGNTDTNLIGTVSPIPEGFWVAIGHPSDRGVLVDSNEWEAFLKLVGEIDSYVKENYEKARD